MRVSVSSSPFLEPIAKSQFFPCVAANRIPGAFHDFVTKSSSFQSSTGRGEGGRRARRGGVTLADPLNQLPTKLRSISEILVLFLFSVRWHITAMLLSLFLTWLTSSLI